MRIVPETADTAMQHAGADAINWQFNDKSPQKIFRLGWPAMLDAAPSAGCVSREMVERLARALGTREWRRLCDDPSATAWWWTDERRGEEDAIACQQDDLAAARDAIAALGLTVAPAADTARNGEAE